METKTKQITFKNGKLLDLNKLPVELQKQLYAHATYDIYKDKARDNIKAKQINLDKTIDQWILNKKSPATKETYRIYINHFLNWTDKMGIDPVLISAEQVDNFIAELKSKFKPNSVRLIVFSCSSFFQTLRRYGHITINPFRNAPLPDKHYAKAIQTDQSRTIPVMTKQEYKIIMAELENQARRSGKHISNSRARNNARRLIPAIHFMASYGLRIGAIPGIELIDKNFTYTTKGNKSDSRKLKTETIALIKRFDLNKRPFKHYEKLATLKYSVKRLTRKLFDNNKIKYSYTAHDFRHYFSLQEYTRNKDIVDLKNKLNHSSLAMTDIYLQNIGIK